MPEARFVPASLMGGIPALEFTFYFAEPTSLYGSPEFEEAVAWCAENLGEDGSTEVRRWTYNSRSHLIFIRDRTDAAAFKLRWC